MSIEDFFSSDFIVRSDHEMGFLSPYQPSEKGGQEIDNYGGTINGQG